MRTIFVAIAAIFVLLVASAGGAPAAHVYGTSTVFNQHIIENTVISVDPQGGFTPIGVFSEFYTSEITFDGISCFDSAKKQLFWATDFETDFVFGFDLAGKKLLPPKAFDGFPVLALDCNGGNIALFSHVELVNRTVRPVVVALGPGGITHLDILSPREAGSFAIVSAMDSMSSVVALATIAESASAEAAAAAADKKFVSEISVLDLTTGKTTASFTFNCSQQHTSFPQKAFYAGGSSVQAVYTWFDAATRTIHYEAAVIDLATKSCSFAHALPVEGIVTDWAFVGSSPSDLTVVGALATETGTSIMSFDFATGKVSSTIKTKAVLSDLFVDA